MKNFFLLISLLLCVLILFTTSCKEKATNVAATDENVQTAQDNALVDGEFSSIYAMTDDQGSISASSFVKQDNNQIQKLEIKSLLLPNGAIVTFDSSSRILTIDFGSSGCQCRDGIMRRGIIYAQFIGKWRDVGSSVTITLDTSYYVSDMHVQGTRKITFLKLNTISDTVINASVTTPTGVISWNSDRTITKIRGMNTPLDPTDDAYSITETANGINRNGVHFSVTTSPDYPLIKDNSCILKDFISGVVTIINLDKNISLTLNFDPSGLGTCDKQANVTINGKIYLITLR